MTISPNQRLAVVSIISALALLAPLSSALAADRLTVFTGDTNVSGINTFEAGLGRAPDDIMGFASNATWNDYQTTKGSCCTIWGLLNFWKTNAPGVHMILTVFPIAADGTSTLAQAAAGAYDAYWHNAAVIIASFDPTMTIRPFNEFNLSQNTLYYPGSDPTDFIAAWRQFVDTFRAVSPNFKFVWTTSIGPGQMTDPTTAYPGDAYVDIIGMDTYELSTYEQGYTQAQRWAALTTMPFTLNWLASFAAAHGKPIALPEYGSDWNDGYFPTQMASWIKSNNVDFNDYWDIDAGAPFNDSFATNPLNGNAYFAAWSGAPAAPAPTVPSTPAPAPDTVAPSIPTGLSGTAVSTSEIDLSWSASSDNVGVTGYDVYRNGVQVGTPAADSFKDAGLTPATAYSYTVMATDAAGNLSSASAALNVTTQPTPATSTQPPASTTPLPSTTSGSGSGTSSGSTSVPTAPATTTAPTGAAFTIGERIETTYTVNVRSAASRASAVIRFEPSGSLGTVMAGPTSADGYIWWNVKYDNGASGWSVQNYLSPASASGTSTTLSNAALIARLTAELKVLEQELQALLQDR